MGTPCFLRGAWRSDGLFWVLFLAAEKKCLAVKGETHKNNPRTQAASKRDRGLQTAPTENKSHAGRDPQN